MRDRERARFEAFIRIDRFGRDYAADFSSGTVGAQQFAEIAAVIAWFEELSAEQTAGFGNVEFSTTCKATARENLREEMSEISRTSRAMVYRIPAINALFRMQRGVGDINLLAAGRAFYEESEHYNSDFVEFGLPHSFREDLQQAINDFAGILSTQGTALDGRVAATAEIGEAIRRGMIARRILDAVVRNRYNHEVGKLAAWVSASHIERAPRRKKEPAPAS